MYQQSSLLRSIIVMTIFLNKFPTDSVREMVKTTFRLFKGHNVCYIAKFKCH